MAVNIRIDVDDADVDIAIAKLQQAVTLQGMITRGGLGGTRGGTRTLMAEWRAFEKSASGISKFTTELTLLQKVAGADLPTINRDLRVLFGQVPGMRGVMQLLFRIKRLQRGVGKLEETGAMLPLTLSLLATAIILFQQAKRYFDAIERDKRERETLIRRGRGFTHEEYLAEMERWKLYSRSIPP